MKRLRKKEHSIDSTSTNRSDCSLLWSNRDHERLKLKLLSRNRRRSRTYSEQPRLVPQLALQIQSSSKNMSPGRYKEKYELNHNPNSKDYGTLRDDLMNQTKEGFTSTDNIVNEFEEDNGICMPDISPTKCTCFRDGKRKIDYVLVYEELKHPDKKQLILLNKQEKWRQKFLGNLRKVGLDMEEESIDSEKKTIYFIKLSVPWPVLVDYAEDLSVRAPLQIHANASENWSERILSLLRIPNVMKQKVPNCPPDFYTCVFKKSKIDRFLGSDNHEDYFTTAQRIRITYEILQKTVYGKRRKAEIGIDRLVEEKVYTAAYPLHDGDFKVQSHQVIPELLNKRQVLYKYWARWGQWFRYQPLDHIREYFGEKIGIYFAWLGFYTGWLLPAALVGLFVFLYGIFTMVHDIPSTEICNSGKGVKMCPLCDESVGCPYWYLSSTCVYAKIAYLFDHGGTVFYAVFVSFWAVSFLEYWKRKNASLAHHWDCLDFEEEEERPRPDFAAKAPMVEKNPITGIKEPSFPLSIRLKRMAAGIGVIILMMTLVMIFIVAVIVYRVLVSIPLFQNKLLSARAMIIASTTGAVVNLILIMSLGRVYEMLAYKLTEWEMHRTQTDFDDNLIFKVFLFQFVNFYSSIFYIAFFKGKFVGYPGNYSHILGLRNEDCNNGGCLMELAQQLAVIMIGKQIINNIQEMVVPKLKTWWHQKSFKHTENQNRWEEDYNLIEHEGLFQEYLEMVLQFGFITIFVAAFPLAPLFALLNNWVEIRLDAQKMVCETRRIVPERAQDIGVWFKILETLAHLAVISNAFLIAFTSDFLPKLLYQYEFKSNLEGYTNFTLAYAPNGTMTEECRYRGYRGPDGKSTIFYWRLLVIRLGFVIVFEHVVFSVCKLIDWVVPDVPESLEIKIKRERYLAKQALADSDNLMMYAQANDDEDDALSPDQNKA